MNSHPATWTSILRARSRPCQHVSALGPSLDTRCVGVLPIQKGGIGFHYSEHAEEVLVGDHEAAIAGGRGAPRGAAAGFPPSDDRDPPLRGRDPAALQPQPGARLHPPVHGPGGGRGRRLRGAAPDGLDALHVSRPRRGAGDGRAARPHLRRDPRQGERALRRQGRLDAPDRRQRRRLRLVRDRRRPSADRHRLRPSPRSYSGDDDVCALLLRRRRDQHRRLPRGAEPRRGLEAARSIFVCENNLYGEYSPLATTTPIERARRPRRRLRDARRARSTATTSRAVYAARRRGGRAGARGRRADADRGDDLPPQGPLAHRSRRPTGPKAEVEEWLARDPIPALERVLVAAGVDAERIEQLREAAAAHGRRAPRARAGLGRPGAGARASRTSTHERTVTYKRGDHSSAMADALEADERRLHARRGHRRGRRRVQDHRGPDGAVRRATACSTRRSPSRRSSAPRSAPRSRACGRSPS